MKPNKMYMLSVLLSFWGVFWVDTSMEETAKQGFNQIAKNCGISDESIGGVTSWLAGVGRPWLLILDNADNPEVDYSKYFPPGNVGSIILVTRESAHSTLSTVGWERLTGLDKRDATKLLFQATKTGHEPSPAKQSVAEKVVAHWSNSLKITPSVTRG